MSAVSFTSMARLKRTLTIMGAPFAVALLVVSSAPAKATTIWDNGLGADNQNSSQYSSELRGYIVWDDFTLANPASINKVFFQEGLTSGPFDGSFRLTINNFGLNTTVGAYTLNPGDYSATPNSISSFPFGPFYDVTFSIPTLNLLADHHYAISFLGLGDMDFRTPNVGGAGNFWQRPYPIGSLSTITGDTPFRLEYDAPSSVPLPAALPLFAGGLGVMGLLGWRRKRKAMAEAGA